MDDAHRLDLMIAVGRELLSDPHRVDAMAPIARHKVDFEPEAGRHRLPKARKMAGLEHQNPVAGRQTVRQCRFPRPGARGRVDHHRLFGLKHPFHAGDDFLGQLEKFRAAMVYCRRRYRLQNAVWHIGRPGDLQKVAAARPRWSVALHHRCPRRVKRYSAASRRGGAAAACVAAWRSIAFWIAAAAWPPNSTWRFAAYS